MGSGKFVQLGMRRWCGSGWLARPVVVGGMLWGVSQALVAQQSLSTAWQPVGPAQVQTAAYGKVTGRVTAIAIDSTDATGNTVYLGTTGGGVWKSTNAAGPASAVSFAPLTDTLPVFSANAGTPAIPSLSIGAVSVQGNVVLAGTGDPNNAADSYYGEGLLRSADGGLTWMLIRNSQDGANGNHSFTGLSFAGFAWSGVSPGTVVAAVALGRGPAGRRDRYAEQHDGAVLLDGLRRDLADEHGDGRGADCLAAAACERQSWGQCGDGGGLESGSEALLCGAAVPWLLRVSRWHHVDASRAAAGFGADRERVSGEYGRSREQWLPDLPRGVGG